jgi:hypothetical protein
LIAILYVFLDFVFEDSVASSTGGQGVSLRFNLTAISEAVDVPSPHAPHSMQRE